MAAARQIKTIYAIGRQLGILEPGNPDDELHAFVAGISGKSSIKELSIAEAEAVITALRQRQREKPKTSGKRYSEVPGGITVSQQRMVWALMYELQRLDKEPNGKSLGARLCGIIKKELEIEARSENPFAWVDFNTGTKLLEVLKGYVATAKRKAGVAR